MGLHFVSHTWREHRKKVLWEKLQAILPEISTRLGERYSLVQAENNRESERTRQELRDLQVRSAVENNKWRQIQNEYEHARRTLRNNVIVHLVGEQLPHTQLNGNQIPTSELLDQLEQAHTEELEASIDIGKKWIRAGRLYGDFLRKIKQCEEHLLKNGTELRLIENGRWNEWTEFLKTGGVRVRKTRERYMVMKCPMKECRGFVSNYWKCDLCKVRVCKECREVVITEGVVPKIIVEDNDTDKKETAVIVEEEDSENEEDEKEQLTEPTEQKESTTQKVTKPRRRFDPRAYGHVCNPDTIATVKLLQSSSKACPTCTTRITRSEGCDQMWCTQCQTAFSWKTGQIEKGRIHNPHFYEWQRQHANGGEIPREPGDVPCGGLPWIYDVVDRKCVRFWLGSVFEDSMGGRPGLLQWVHQHTVHLYENELPKARRPLRDYGHHHDLGLGYLLKRFSEDHVRNQLTLRERHVDLYQSTIDIIDMCWTVMGDLFRSVPEALRNRHLSGVNVKMERLEIKKKVKEWAEQICQLISYVNSELARVMSDHKRSGTSLMFQHVEAFRQALEEMR
jgi:hypothetical protein